MMLSKCVYKSLSMFTTFQKKKTTAFVIALGYTHKLTYSHTGFRFHTRLAPHTHTAKKCQWSRTDEAVMLFSRHGDTLSMM